MCQQIDGKCLYLLCGTVRKSHRHDRMSEANAECFRLKFSFRAPHDSKSMVALQLSSSETMCVRKMLVSGYPYEALTLS